MDVVYSSLSDEELLERLKLHAVDWQCRLVEERRGRLAHVGFRSLEPAEPPGTERLSASGRTRRQALEDLLAAVEAPGIRGSLADRRDLSRALRTHQPLAVE